MATLLANRYELGRLLGSGGMARVHEATDRVLGRRVAVKLLRRELAPDAPARARLLSEARAAASFTHPNAVAVYDAGEEAGEPFIVMEYVPGRSLAEELSRRGALPVDEALAHASGVLAALAAAHQRGLVHRDVKPGNVLLAETGEAKLADFGIAKALGEAAASLTATGQVLGTPRYLAPERATGGSATPRSDLYAVGVLLYEMLAGRPPFEGDRPLSVVLAHQHTPVPRLDARQPSVPAWLAGVVERALAKDPADRYPTADAMLEALAGRVGAVAAGPDGTEPGATVALAAPLGEDGGQTGTAGVGSAATAPGERARRRAPLAVLAAGALLAVAAVLVLAAISDGGQSPGGPQADADAAGDTRPAGAGGDPEPEATPTEPGATPTEPEAAAEATDPAALETASEQLPPAEALAAFAAALAGDPDAAGDKGEDLVEDIWEVLSERGRERREEARELMSEIEEWVDEDELDRDVGERALELLEAVASEREDPDDGAEDGRGPEGRGPPGQRGRVRGRGRRDRRGWAPPRERPTRPGAR